MDELNQASHKLAEEIYRQTQKGQPQTGQQPPPKDKKDDVIDAEYKDDDDNHRKQA